MEQTSTEGAKKRPVFLTVLCILSFVAAGITIIGGIMGYLAMAAVGGMADAVGANMEAMEGMEAMPGMEDAMNVMAHAKTLLIVAIAVTLLALAGVIMMWKLKKNGFYIYTAAQVIGIVTPIIIAGMASFSVVGVIISLAFIVMYGLNLKHMS